MDKMTDYELCCIIKNTMARLSAEIWAYNESWGDKFCREHVLDVIKRIKDSNSFHKIDPNNLSFNEALQLKFGRWSEDSSLMLIPLWLMPFLVDSFEGGCIDDETPGMLVTNELDNDHRFGCLAYGIFKDENNG